MNKRLLSSIIVIVVFFFASFPLVSNELGIEYRIGSLNIPDYQVTNSEFLDQMELPNFFYWDKGISLTYTHQFSDNFKFQTGVYSDAILKNISYTHFYYTESIFVMGVGPFFGFLNSNVFPYIEPGISSIVRIEFPGILFADLRVDKTLDVHLTHDNDYFQERTDMSFGFFVPNAICTLSMLSKKFTERETESGTTYELVDELTDYSLKTTIFKKNVPYHLHLVFSYQHYSKSYIMAPDVVTNDLHTILFGIGIDVYANPALFYSLYIDNTLYSFGQEEMLGMDTIPYAFKAYLAMRINFDKIIQSRIIE
ncbi:MAG: hypothetical protein JW881_12230 [Spirochaetales bacterium]|nr:hypothetical protein [Spirochaetales bacterium]